MAAWFRLIMFAAITGTVIALVALNFFPEKIGQGNAQQALASTQASPSAPTAFGPVSYADAVAKAAPAVVNIYTTKVVQQSVHPLFDDPFFRRFFGRGGVPKRNRLQSSLGSGVIIGAEGYLLTNNHVIDNADEIIVALQDGRESKAQVVGTDRDTDLAVLKIDLDQLPVISLASSDRARVGDVVLAIGNPFGVGQTVTMGIVSATGRHQLGVSAFEDFIQTDAAINPGNSGGALIDAQGNLIGINTAIFSKSGGSHGIGFAIPSDLASDIMGDIIRDGSVIRGWLGIQTEPVTAALAQSFGLKEVKGVILAGLYRNGPGHRAGLVPGDVILAISGTEVNSPRQAIDLITRSQPDSSISLRLVRREQELTVKAVVGKRPSRDR